MAAVFRLTQAEEKLAELIWNGSPVSSMALVKMCEDELGWKKSTTFTILKKLTGKGIVRNENATVTAVYTKEQFLSEQSKRYVQDTYDGSLPRFLASFIGSRRLSDKQANELIELINAHKEGEFGG